VHSAAWKQLEFRQFVQSLVQNSASLVPLDMGGGTVAHFDSIITAVNLIVAEQKTQESVSSENSATAKSGA